MKRTPLNALVAVVALTASVAACKKPDPAPTNDVPVASATAPLAATAPAASGHQGGGAGGGAGAGGTAHTKESDNAAPGTFGATCNADTDCKSGACAHGGRGAFCSIKCKTDEDCAKPPAGGKCKDSGYCNR